MYVAPYVSSFQQQREDYCWFKLNKAAGSEGGTQNKYNLIITSSSLLNMFYVGYAQKRLESLQLSLAQV